MIEQIEQFCKICGGCHQTGVCQEDIENEKVLEKKELIINSTIDFQKALSEGKLAEAERWLFEVSSTLKKEGYNERWRDHRERELFQAYCKSKDWTSAKRIIENSIKPTSKEGRTKRLEELSGMKHQDIKED